jgi:hypothetical protein
MLKWYKIVAVLTGACAVLAVGYFLTRPRCGQKAGILGENIAHSGDTWTADFRARVPAPESAVFRAMQNVKNVKSDQILDVKELSSHGNTRMVEVDFAGPTGASEPTQFTFRTFTGPDRIVYKSLDSQVFRIDGDCQIEPECAATIIECKQVTNLLQERPLTDGVVKENIRQLFLAQIDNLRSTLHLQIPDQSDEGDDDDP